MRLSTDNLKPKEADTQRRVTDTREYTGGSVSYYSVNIEHPTKKGRAPYTAECNDIIEALRMNSAQGNIFKAVWRMCAAARGLGKRGYDDGLYDAEKIVFFGEREVVRETVARASAPAPEPRPEIKYKPTRKGVELSAEDYQLLLKEAGRA